MTVNLESDLVFEANTYSLIRVLGKSALVWLLCASMVRAEQSEAIAAYESSLRDLIVTLEHQVDVQEKLHSRGFASASSVDGARVWLTKAAYDLAVVQRDKKRLRELTAQLVGIRQRQLGRLQELRARGQDLTFPFLTAKRRLAMSKYLHARQLKENEESRAALQEGALLCEREVELRRNALEKKMATRAGLSHARNRLACANYRLAKITPGEKPLIEELSRAADGFRADWRKVKELRETGAAMKLDLLIYRASLLNAEIRLANELDDDDKMKRCLSELVEVDAQALTLIRKPGISAFLPQNIRHSLISGLTTELAHDRLRLQLKSDQNELIDDLMMSVLDP